jgi:hypothetical protein
MTEMLRTISAMSSAGGYTGRKDYNPYQDEEEYNGDPEARYGLPPRNQHTELSFRISRNAGQTNPSSNSREKHIPTETSGDQQLKSILKSPKDRIFTGTNGTGCSFRSPDQNLSVDIQERDQRNQVSSNSSPNRTRSPAERKLMRQYEKENSPVRAFLNARQNDE